MRAPSQALDVPTGFNLRVSLPTLVSVAALVLLFWSPMHTLVRDWWTDPDAGEGLLLAPVALYLAKQRGFLSELHPRPILGLVGLFGAVVLRYLAGLAAEIYTMRLSLLIALIALVIFHYGIRQVLHWWLSVVLLVLSIPLPTVVMNSIALPLQFKASQIGAWLLASRHIPVLLTGNVIHLPGRSLFVTEACSGLRSISSLIALSVLIGGLWLRSPLLRVILVTASIPVAMVLNGIRIFLTGFLVFYVNPSLGEGLMHLSEGWVLFMAAFAILSGIAWLLYLVDSPRTVPL